MYSIYLCNSVTYGNRQSLNVLRLPSGPSISYQQQRQDGEWKEDEWRDLGCHSQIENWKAWPNPSKTGVQRVFRFLCPGRQRLRGAA